MHNAFSFIGKLVGRGGLELDSICASDLLPLFLVLRCSIEQ